MSVVEVGREKRTKNLEAKITFTLEKNRTSGRARRYPRKTSSDSKNKKKTFQWEISFVFMLFSWRRQLHAKRSRAGRSSNAERSSSETKKISTLFSPFAIDSHTGTRFSREIFAAACRRFWEDKSCWVSRVLTVYVKTYCFLKMWLTNLQKQVKNEEKTLTVTKFTRLSDFRLGIITWNLLRFVHVEWCERSRRPWKLGWKVLKFALELNL